MLRIESLPFRIIAVITALVFLSVPLMAQTAAVDEDYIKGKSDGERDTGALFGWFWAGFFLGPLGVLIANLHKPSPPAGAFIGKSQTYVAGYTEGYRNVCARKQGRKAIYGCGTMCLIGTAGWIVYRSVNGLEWYDFQDDNLD